MSLKFFFTSPSVLHFLHPPIFPSSRFFAGFFFLLIGRSYIVLRFLPSLFFFHAWSAFFKRLEHCEFFQPFLLGKLSISKERKYRAWVKKKEVVHTHQPTPTQKIVTPRSDFHFLSPLSPPSSSSLVAGRCKKKITFLSLFIERLSC